MDTRVHNPYRHLVRGMIYIVVALTLTVAGFSAIAYVVAMALGH